jgi:hypothetical protein
MLDGQGFRARLSRFDDAIAILRGAARQIVMLCDRFAINVKLKLQMRLRTLAG